MIKLITKNEFTADVPVANSGELCSHGERLATAQSLGNRTHNLNTRATEIEAITVVGTGKLLKYADALNSLSDLVLPDKGGLVNVIKTMGEGLAGWVKYVTERMPGVAPGDQILTWPPVLIGGLGTWTFGDAASVPFVTQAVLDGTRVYFALPGLPRWGYFKGASITIAPDTGHVALPATKPRLSAGRILVDVPTGANSYSEVGALDDASADATAYNATHSIILTGVSVPLATAPYKHFYLKFTGEGGANSIAGLKVIGVTATVGGTP